MTETSIRKQLKLVEEKLLIMFDEQEELQEEMILLIKQRDRLAAKLRPKESTM
jgi:hypothetical protein